MPPIRIVPAYTLMLRFDVRPGLHERYFRYVVGEFVPAMQDRQVYMQDAWHIVHGPYPERQVEFITETLQALRDLFDDPQWQKMEEKLLTYVENYSRRVSRYQGVFKV